MFPDGTGQDVIPLGKQLCDLFRDAGRAMNCVDIPGYDHRISPLQLPAKLVGIHCYNANGQAKNALSEAGLDCVYHDGPFKPSEGMTLNILAIVIGNAM